MKESLFTLIAGGFALLAIWFGWRYFAIRRSMVKFARKLRQKADEESLEPLEVHIPEVDLVAGAVSTLTKKFSLLHDTLDAERSRLAAVLAQLTDGVLIADADGLIQFANPAAKSLFGGTLEDNTVTVALRHHQLIEAWQKCQESGVMQVESVEVPNRRQFLQLIVMPDQHAPGGTLLLVQDLTRVRRLETVRRDFISNISHELRTPLASLKALTETLQDGAIADPDAAERFLSRMATEVDALTQMAQELLDLSRIESGQVELQRKPVAPLTMLQSAAERMHMQAERARLSLEVDCPSDLPEVQVDALRIEQVLVNLIHNAVKFTPPGGTVALSAELASPSEPTGDGSGAESLVRFAVRDTGAGIPGDDVPRIFERFYRVDKSRSGGGTGLGLSISRHLVESHGGHIWVESVEGQGSTFFFTLPVQATG